MKNKKIFLHSSITILLIAIFISILCIGNDIMVMNPETSSPAGMQPNTLISGVSGTQINTAATTPAVEPSPHTSENPSLTIIQQSATSQPSPTKPSAEELSITINFAGDFLIHDRLYKLAEQKDGTYDFSNLFKDVGYLMKGADFTVANLETTFAGSAAGYSGYPRFNCPDALASAMKNIMGIDLVITANNHCMDKGIVGLERTINVINENGMQQTGTYKSAEIAEKPLVIDINGINVTFLNYTYSLNGIKLPKGYEYAANMIDKNKIQKDAQKARDAGAEFIICLPHWGTEYKTTESDSQRKLAKWIFENTEVDMIVGGHPHVVQPADYMKVTTKNNKEKTGFVLYSLGNFMSDHSTVADYVDTGIILNATLVKSSVDGKIRLAGSSYIPVVIDRTKGHASDKCVRGLNDAIISYESGRSETVIKSEYTKFLEYRKYYKELFANIMEEMVLLY